MRRRLTVSGKSRGSTSVTRWPSLMLLTGGDCGRALGKAADKLVKITDKYLPRVTAEARVYIMKFPHKIPVLLKQARKVRKKAKSRAAQGGNKPLNARGQTAEPVVRGGPSTSSKASPSNLDPKASGGQLEEEKSSEASDSRADSQEPLEGEIPARQSTAGG